MERFVLQKLKDWKNKPAEKRKPLILEGARQTGKTWLARELGRCEFEEYVEINFEDNEQIRSLFEMDFDIERILMALRSVTGKSIVAGKTLVFFDEIQYARRGLLSLKYFGDKKPELHVIAAGSLLGVIDHKNDSFPVGKVEFERVYPLSYEEFLTALGKDGLVKILHTMDWTLINSFSSQYVELLRQYYYVGGMPEVVKTFVEEKSYLKVRNVQLSLLKSYEKDFSKHPPQEIVKRMVMLWNTIPSQLAKENRKFIYTAIRPSARARDFETSIQWLCDAGVAYKVTRTRAGEMPLKGFEDADVFKLYVLDIGLQGAMSGLDSKSLILGNEFFKQYKGALTEQYVLQQLLLHDEIQIHYWTPDTGIAEVDFVVQFKGVIIPVEVKAEINLRAKSLVSFIRQYNTPLVIRTSLSNFAKGRTITDLPLYAIGLLPKIVETV